MYATLLIIPFLLVGISSWQNIKDPVSKGMSTWRRTTPVPFIATTSPGHSHKSCGYRKECVRTFLCSSGRMNHDGATIFNVRFDEDSLCEFLETCCSIDNIADEPILRPSANIVQAGCGYRKVNGVGFTITGASASEAEFGEFPWVVAVLREEQIIDSKVSVYHSGGSLIAPHIVLTAAHSVEAWPSKSFKVRAGEWEVKSKNEPYPTQDRYIVDVIVHEHFNNSNLRNDIALLVLETPFDLAPNVNTICLPPAGYNFDYSQCVATGWGKDKFSTGLYVNILKKINLPAVPHAQCEQSLRRTRLSRYFELHSSFMCAGGEDGKDACTGDGGSPLICPIRGQTDRYYQAGIVAWGIGCGDVNVPGVYASVASLRDWIDQQLTYKGVPSYYYTASQMS